MTIQDFFIFWQDLGLFLYAIGKAFLPLPSLEVILVPLTLATPEKWIWYSLLGGAGTMIGGGIGYLIAKEAGRKVLSHLACETDIEKGEILMDRYGIWAVLIGGITPIPDFLLAYLAGITRMPFLRFALCDAGARICRSLLVCFALIRLEKTIQVDRFGTWFSLLILGWLLVRWGKEKWRIHRQEVR